MKLNWVAANVGRFEVTEAFDEAAMRFEGVGKWRLLNRREIIV